MGQFDAGFEGTVALVTGGASGIGRATSRRLAQEGAKVVVADVDENGGKSVAEEIGGDFERLDVSDPEAWQATIAGIVERHGGLQFAHLNAGITTFKAEPEDLVDGFDLGTLPIANYRRIMATNVDGVILGASACVGAIGASGGGCIVATASAAGVIAFPPDPIYTSTKHAVVGFIRAQAPLLEPAGIMLHAVLPGVVDTNLLTRDFADEARAIGIKVMSPDEIAEGVVRASRSATTGGLWLCLPEQEPFEYQFAPVTGLGIPDTV